MISQWICAGLFSLCQTPKWQHASCKHFISVRPLRDGSTQWLMKWITMFEWLDYNLQCVNVIYEEVYRVILIRTWWPLREKFQENSYFRNFWCEISLLCTFNQGCCCFKVHSNGYATRRVHEWVYDSDDRLADRFWQPSYGMPGSILE